MTHCPSLFGAINKDCVECFHLFMPLGTDYVKVYIQDIVVSHFLRRNKCLIPTEGLSILKYCVYTLSPNIVKEMLLYEHFWENRDLSYKVDRSKSNMLKLVQDEQKADSEKRSLIFDALFPRYSNKDGSQSDRQTALINFFLEFGLFSINKTNKFLNCAIEKKRNVIVSNLINNYYTNLNTDVNFLDKGYFYMDMVDKQPPIYVAIAVDNFEAFKMIFNHKDFKLEKNMYKGMTLLEYAAEKNSSQIATFLIKLYGRLRLKIV